MGDPEIAMGVMKRHKFALGLVVAIFLVSMVAAEEEAAVVALPSVPGSNSANLLEDGVTPKIPDGPVVQKFKKLQAKKKLDKMIVKQSKVLKPLLKRKKIKKKAVQNKLAMLADLEIKDRKSKAELRLKTKARNDAKVREARKQSAKKRRTERYEKTMYQKAESSKESVSKLHKQTKKALALATKLSKMQSKAGKKMAMKVQAQMAAKKKESLLAGGVIHMSGSQFTMKHLTDLNKNLVKALKHPSHHSLKMAQVVYDHAAKKVGVENEGYMVLQRKRIAHEKGKKENERKQKASAKDRKIKTVTRLIRQERRAKARRQENMRKTYKLGKERQRKKWVSARHKVNAARAKLLRNEKSSKRKFNNKMAKLAAEKNRKAPMEAYVKSKQVVKERGSKVMKAKKPARKFIAKQMKERAIKRMKEKGRKANKHVVRRRRRINYRRRRHNYRRRRHNYRRRRGAWSRGSVRKQQIKLRSGYCLDASQRNRSGGKVHMWPCNKNNWNQQWDFNSYTGLIKNSHGVCLDASQRNTRGGKVHMWGCNSRNFNQKWRYSHGNGQIRNMYGICLYAGQRNSAGGKVQMQSCTAGHSHQSWYISGFRL